MSLQKEYSVYFKTGRKPLTWDIIHQCDEVLPKSFIEVGAGNDADWHALWSKADLRIALDHVTEIWGDVDVYIGAIIMEEDMMDADFEYQPNLYNGTASACDVDVLPSLDELERLFWEKRAEIIIT